MKSPQIDILLEPLLLAATDEQADELLSQLIRTHAQSLIKGIIHYKLHLSTGHADRQADAEDLYQEVLMQLLVELRRLRHQPEEHPISDVRGLAAVITHRACSRWMRREFPERHSLKNSLRYMLTHHRSFALWQSSRGVTLVGFAEWRRQNDAATSAKLRGLSDDVTVLAQLEPLKTSRLRVGLAGLLAAIFNFVSAPLNFDDLFVVLVELLLIRDRPTESVDGGEDRGASALSAPEPDAAWRAEKRIFLERLWEELRLLPLNQRSALLLNLKDSTGRGCVALFSATGVATIRQLAEALEMNEDRFAELWNELPLEDSRIAELLKLTRQQVINARKSARERLARRLRGFI